MPLKSKEVSKSPRWGCECCKYLQIMMCTLTTTCGTYGDTVVSQVCIRLIQYSRFLYDSSLLHSGSSIRGFFGSHFGNARSPLLQSSWAWDLALFHDRARQGHASASWRPPMCERQHSRRPTLFCSNFSGKAGEDAVVQTFAGSVQTEFFSASICQGYSRFITEVNPRAWKTCKTSLNFCKMRMFAPFAWTIDDYSTHSGLRVGWLRFSVYIQCLLSVVASYIHRMISHGTHLLRCHAMIEGYWGAFTTTCTLHADANHCPVVFTNFSVKLQYLVGTTAGLALSGFADLHHAAPWLPIPFPDRSCVLLYLYLYYN